jgi:hypothetical protein
MPPAVLPGPSENRGRGVETWAVERGGDGFLKDGRSPLLQAYCIVVDIQWPMRIRTELILWG